jgi:large subunit ribosomal protein L9
MKQATVWRRAAELRRAEVKAEYHLLASRINETTLSFVARAGNTGKLYGSVTTAQIADELNETLGTEIDRRKVGVEPLRQLGEHKVVVRLSSDFQPELTVLVIPEGEVGQTSFTSESPVTEDESQDSSLMFEMEAEEEAEES